MSMVDQTGLSTTAVTIPAVPIAFATSLNELSQVPYPAPCNPAPCRNTTPGRPFPASTGSRTCTFSVWTSPVDARVTSMVT